MASLGNATLRTTRTTTAGPGLLGQQRLPHGNPVACNLCCKAIGHHFVALSCKCLICFTCANERGGGLTHCPRCKRSIDIAVSREVQLGEPAPDLESGLLHRLFATNGPKPLTYPELLSRMEKDVEDVLFRVKLVCSQSRIDSRRSIQRTYKLSRALKAEQSKAKSSHDQMMKLRNEMESYRMENGGLHDKISELQKSLNAKDDQLAKFRSIHGGRQGDTGHLSSSHKSQNHHGHSGSGLLARNPPSRSQYGHGGHGSSPAYGRNLVSDSSRYPTPEGSGFAYRNDSSRNGQVFRANKRRKHINGGMSSGGHY